MLIFYAYGKWWYKKEWIQIYWFPKHTCSSYWNYWSKSTSLEQIKLSNKEITNRNDKCLMILGMSFLVYPLTLGDASWCSCTCQSKGVTFVFYSVGHTYSDDRVVAATNTALVNSRESPMVVIFEALGRHVVGMTNGFILSSIVHVWPSSFESSNGLPHPLAILGLSWVPSWLLKTYFEFVCESRETF